MTQRSDVVLLELPGQELGTILASLMEGDRSVELNPESIFYIDRKWLINLVDLLMQRIASQNDASLIQFQAIIYYRSGRRLIFTEPGQLLSQNDTFDDLTVGVRVTFSYLVTFPYSQTPAKQEISIFARSESLQRLAQRDLSQSMRHVLLPVIADSERLAVRVKFTDVTFSEDIISLIMRHIDQFFPRRSRIIEQLRSISFATIPFFFMIYIMISTILSNERNRLKAIDRIKQQSVNFSDTTGSMIGIEKKLNALYYISEAKTNGADTGAAAVGVLSFLALIVGIYVILLLRPVSYIALNDYSERWVEKSRSRRRAFLGMVFLTIAMSIIVNVASNGLYDFAKYYFVF